MVVCGCRYTYSSHLGSRLSCALLAAELLPAVFCGDIVHPQRRLDFAAYVPLEIWPSVDVFEDAYRCGRLLVRTYMCRSLPQ